MKPYLLLVILAGCSIPVRESGDPAIQPAGRQPPSDAAYFDAAIRGLHALLDDEPIKVDPHPIRIVDAIGYPQTSDYYTQMDDVVASRLDAIRALHLDSVRIIPLLDDCTALFAPPSRRITDGCPADDLIMVAFDTLASEPGTDRKTLRAITIEYTERGRSATISDLIIGVVNGAAVLEEEKILVNIS